MEKIETTNLSKVFILIFLIVLMTTLIVYKLFGFEISILYCISMSTGFIAMAFTGLENIIILTKK